MSREIRIPPFPEVQFLSLFLTELIAYIDRADNNKMSRITENNSVLLHAPNGATWEIKVDDAGALTSTKVAG